MKIPVVSIVGKSGSGKTTLLCGLIPELKAKGYKVATIKHDVHGFEMDKPGKDTWKHAEAGADTVVISSPGKVAMIEKVDMELTMDQVIAKITNVDIILTEGYKRNDKPKIEIFRSSVHDRPLCGRDDNLLAFAGDIVPDLDVPLFSPGDYRGMADLIEDVFLKNR
jgi:molybdopterin-guanine dinucleotide biosynthesis adapter protein